MRFFNEKMINDSLIQETRILTMPDESTRRVKAFKLCWEVHDFLLDYENHKHDQFVLMAWVIAELSGRSFETEFFCVVDASQRWLNERRRIG